jgi:uncharacterized protein involved in exopolysaccharide biosynthesis
MSEAGEFSRNDLSLLVLLGFLGRHKLLIVITICLFTAGGTLIAFLLIPTYRADVVVSPAEGTGGPGELGGLGGLASLAGISLGGGGKKAEESLGYLRSRAFTAGFIERHGLLPILFAKKWDASRNTWRDPDDAPTMAEGVSKFAKRIRQIEEDKRTGIVTLSIIWTDRFAAADWANALIAEADKALRERAIGEQTRSVQYLRSEAAQTTTVEIATAISKLTETELKNAMVARTRDAYAFKVLDPAVAPDRKDTYSPNKPLFISLSAFFGMVAGIVLAAIRERRAKRR